MPNLLLDLEIDAACWEFLAQRIHARGGPGLPQPIVTVLNAPPNRDEDPDWDQLTAKARRYLPQPGDEPSFIEATEAMLGKMGV